MPKHFPFFVHRPPLFIFVFACFVVNSPTIHSLKTPVQHLKQLIY